MRQPRRSISLRRRAESFADDLNTRRGIVSGRVALLPRSTEIQPLVARIRPSRTTRPSVKARGTREGFRVLGEIFETFPTPRAGASVGFIRSTSGFVRSSAARCVRAVRTPRGRVHPGLRPSGADEEATAVTNSVVRQSRATSVKGHAYGGRVHQALAAHPVRGRRRSIVPTAGRWRCPRQRARPHAELAAVSYFIYRIAQLGIGATRAHLSSLDGYETSMSRKIIVRFS